MCVCACVRADVHLRERQERERVGTGAGIMGGLLGEGKRKAGREEGRVGWNEAGRDRECVCVLESE